MAACASRGPRTQQAPVTQGLDTDSQVRQEQPPEAWREGAGVQGGPASEQRDWPSDTDMGTDEAAAGTSGDRFPGNKQLPWDLALPPQAHTHPEGGNAGSQQPPPRESRGGHPGLCQPAMALQCPAQPRRGRLRSREKERG